MKAAAKATTSDTTRRKGTTSMTDHDGRERGESPAWGGFLSMEALVRLSAAVTTLVLTGGIPWASWITYTLIVISQQTLQIREHNDAALKRIERLEEQSTTHAAQLQVIAATRFTSEDARAMVKQFDDRMTRFELKIDQLSADVSSLTRANSRLMPQRGQEGMP